MGRAKPLNENNNNIPYVNLRILINRLFICIIINNMTKFKVKLKSKFEY